MQYSVATLVGFAALAMATPSPQAVTKNLTPSSPAPPGCSSSYPNSFYISTVNASSPSSKMVKRQSPNLSITLEDGVLKDQDGNIGYIASNKQFQFADGATPNAQAGSIYTGGFSVCANNSIALGGTAVFQSCNSGSFDNLYYGNDAAQCDNVYINAIDTGKTSGGSSGGSSSSVAAPSYSASATAGVGGMPDNQPTAPVAAGPTPTPVTPSASMYPPTGAPAPTQYTGGAAIATAAPMAMAAAGAFLAML